MEKKIRLLRGMVMVALLVAGSMVQSASAEQHVMCLKQIQVDVTSKLPDGFWQTPQVGNLINKKMENIGGKMTLMCGYRVYNTTVFIMHAVPEGTKACKPDMHGFVCK
jgi:hypothetical protein